jgi:hypothetical protein
MTWPEAAIIVAINWAALAVLLNGERLFDRTIGSIPIFGFLIGAPLFLSMLSGGLVAAVFIPPVVFLAVWQVIRTVIVWSLARFQRFTAQYRRSQERHW